VTTIADKPRALLVSPSDGWRLRVGDALAGAPVAVAQFSSARKALDAFEREPAGYELAVLDAQAGDLSGLALCRRLRELPGGEDLAIVFVSGLCDEMDRILAFENGADDFVTEPFFPRELASRVRALVRRRQRPLATEPLGEIRVGPLRLDLHGSVVEVDGRRVPLTRRELEVLRRLVQQEGRVVARQDLSDGASEATEATSLRVVDTHVKSIRHKLGAARDLIQTVRGVGYRFDASH
jgi:two-component system phosphate regulon response regulator PhoB